MLTVDSSSQISLQWSTSTDDCMATHFDVSYILTNIHHCDGEPQAGPTTRQEATAIDGPSNTAVLEGIPSNTEVSVKVTPLVIAEDASDTMGRAITRKTTTDVART